MTNMRHVGDNALRRPSRSDGARGATIRNLRIAGMLAVATAASGCAYLQPYVDVYPTGAVAPIAPALPQTTDAVRAIDAWGAVVEKKHHDVSLANRSLNVATFGLAAGAVVAPVYKAYTDLISALALGAGVSFTANTLFFPPDQITLYGAASLSLACIRQRGGTFSASLSPEGSATKLGAEYDSLMQRLPKACINTPEHQKLEAAFIGADSAMQRVEGSDGAAAFKLRQAGQNVVIALNAEIDKRAPSPQAVFAAAKSLASFVPAPPTKADTPPKPVGVAAALGTCPADAKALMNRQAAYYEQRQRAVDQGLEAINGLDTACVFDAAPLPELAVDQSEITIVEGAKVNITVKGGRPPYRAGFDKQVTGVLLSQPLPDRFMVEGATGIKDDSAKLTVYDSSATGASKVIAVKAKKS